MTDTLATFEAQRSHLIGIAYRMLGDMAAAEDVAQDAWLRWQSTAAAEIADPRAWLTTVSVRLCLDTIRRTRSRRETYVGPWLPEPLLPEDTRIALGSAPDSAAELASDVSYALMLALERLSGEERAALILHDAFELGYAVIAETLGKSEPACRKLVSRARERVRAQRPRNAVSRAAHLALIERFVAASQLHDLDALKQLLASDVALRSDGGGEVPAALNVLEGVARVSAFLHGLIRLYGMLEDAGNRIVDINGDPALLITTSGRVDTVLNFASDGARFTSILAMRNPTKLARIVQRFPAL